MTSKSTCISSICADSNGAYNPQLIWSSDSPHVKLKITQHFQWDMMLLSFHGSSMMGLNQNIDSQEAFVGPSQGLFYFEYSCQILCVYAIQGGFRHLGLSCLLAA